MDTAPMPPFDGAVLTEVSATRVAAPYGARAAPLRADQ